MGYKSNIPKFKKQFGDRNVVALHVIGTFLDGEATARTPVNKQGGGGNLRASNRFVVNESNLSVAIGNTAEYSPFVEFGTGQRGSASSVENVPDDYKYGEEWMGMEAQPFITPAIMENKKRIGELYRKVMKT